MSVPVAKKRKTTLSIHRSTSATDLRSQILSDPASSPHIQLEESDSDEQVILPEPNTFVVLKFGGSSVASPPRLQQVVQVIKSELSKQAQNSRPARVAVVVSAMGNTTDFLIDAVEYAVSGDIEASVGVVDHIIELARNNGVETINAMCEQS